MRRPGWSEVIAEAQELVALQIHGVDYPRIPYGAEPRVSGHDGIPIEPPARCHDCGVQMGKLHVPNCDMERCPSCKCQIIGCGCDLELEVYACGCRLRVADSEGGE